MVKESYSLNQKEIFSGLLYRGNIQLRLSDYPSETHCLINLYNALSELSESLRSIMVMFLFDNV